MATTNTLYTLDISSLSLTTNIPRKINEYWLSSSQWTKKTVIDPIYVQSSNNEWPAMFTGTSTPTYTSTSNYGWILYPSGGEYRTNLALKFDYNLKEYVDLTDFASTMSTTRYSGSCNTNDGIYLYSIGGRGSDNADNMQKVRSYHIENDKWTVLTDLPRQLWGSSCTVLNGILYNFGGQTGSNANSILSTIYAYNTITQGSWSSVGNLLLARNHAISVNHPNDWILTVGGRQATDKMAQIIELYDPMSKESFDTGMRYERKNEYHALYPYDLNTNILFVWGGIYDPDNIKLSVYNDMQYIVLSKYDAIEPTSSPTAAPTHSPMASPTLSPTLSSMHPTNVPSQSPEKILTMNPTASPTNEWNEGQVFVQQTTQHGEKEKMESNIIVNVVQNEMWLALSIIVVAFMFLCFCGIIFCVFTKYKYDKMKYDENTTSIQSHSSMNEETGHSKIELLDLKKPKETDLDIRMKEEGDIEANNTNNMNTVGFIGSDDSDSESFGNVNTPNGIIAVPNIENKKAGKHQISDSDAMYVQQRRIDRMLSKEAESMYNEQQEQIMTPTLACDDDDDEQNRNDRIKTIDGTAFV